MLQGPDAINQVFQIDLESNEKGGGGRERTVGKDEA